MQRSATYAEWLAEHPEWTLPFPPMIGAADDGDGEDDGEAEGQGEGGTDEGQGNGESHEEEHTTTPEEAGRLKAENQRLKREAAARERERRQAEKQAKAAEDERKAQAGEWQKLAEERAGRVGELEQELADLKSSIERDKQRSNVEKVADSLNFRRPRRAYALLADELDPDTLAETLADEQLTTAALRRIARAEPELVDQTRRSGAPVNGDRQGGLTPQQRANRVVAGLLKGDRVE